MPRPCPSTYLGCYGECHRLTLLNREFPCSIDEDKVLESALAEHWELDNRSATLI